MAEPKEGYNSGIQRVVSSGYIDSDGTYVAGGTPPVSGIEGTWFAETYSGAVAPVEPTNTVASKEIPAGAVALRIRYKDVSSATGVSIGIAVGATNQATGEALIDADAVPRLWLGDMLEMTFTEDTAITRLDWKTAVAETGDSALVVEWKVAL